MLEHGGRLRTAATPNVLLCNPNNPSALTLPRSALLDAAARLQQRGGWLIVYEAYADAEAGNGIAALAGSAKAPNVIVLRSLGKFFGLAGARVGFFFGAAEKLNRLREAIGPWPVSHPAPAVARQALAGSGWQSATRARLAASSQRLAELLAPLGAVSCTALFCTLSVPDNAAHLTALHEHFARRAILTRRFDQHALLRFGLPGSEEQWQQLTTALAEWNLSC